MTMDQAAAIAFRLVNAQVETLVRDGMPPMTVVHELLEIASAWLSHLEPLAIRSAEAEKLSKRFTAAVAAKARERLLAGVVGRKQ
jgi:hypothetical protein